MEPDREKARGWGKIERMQPRKGLRLIVCENDEEYSTEVLGRVSVIKHKGTDQTVGGT